MNDIITTAAIKADVATQELKANLAKRNERGADILEYVGMILLAAVLVAGLFAAASGLVHRDRGPRAHRLGDELRQAPAFWPRPGRGVRVRRPQRSKHHLLHLQPGQ